ncbi:hypothetical protein FM037_11720 [Shewanella psychropiezotolerans]|uniref:Uncharacterized protein n=1 Tax=Shewanella psychropiezotolerans TaxID=2593655 RepID=A0ABX5WXI0_9GAMM|nr:hypothetical protein [Shewanella sp. YLB-07]MPY26553.1 hypothetical protein [Shewanella sp. YLB-07]QDO83784.1 hypothetical protein FM037_11720 [Shewanella psychropiezotolerans]
MSRVNRNDTTDFDVVVPKFNASIYVNHQMTYDIKREYKTTDVVLKDLQLHEVKLILSELIQ